MTELAVGAMGMGKERGGVFILFMNKDGTVKNTQVISSLHGWDHKLNVQDQVCLLSSLFCLSINMYECS